MGHWVHLLGTEKTREPWGILFPVVETPATLYNKTVYTSSGEVLQRLPTYPPDRFDGHGVRLLASRGLASWQASVEGSLLLRKQAKPGPAAHRWNSLLLHNGPPRACSRIFWKHSGSERGGMCLEARGQQWEGWKLHHAKKVCNISWILSQILQWYFN